jgi:hypothetical protein
MALNRGVRACAASLLAAGVCIALGASHLNAQLTLTGGGLTLVQEGPAAGAAGDPAPVNLATGATPFALDELDLGTHYIANLNNGTYGNSSSWIGAGATGTAGPFVGINLGAAPVSDIQSIAFGRSNVLSGDPCGSGVCMDRVTGLFELQYTMVANPDASTADGDWISVGTLDYGASEGPGTNYNNIWQRHRFNFDPVDATGIRLIVPSSGIGGGTAIDEIELYDVPGDYVPPPPPPDPLIITPAAGGYAMTWDGNDGEYFQPTPPAVVPDNAALASNGATPFTSSDLGPTLGIDFHVAGNVNDGLYGNSNSWIGAEASGDYAGVAFAEPVPVTSVAWGRDNGNGMYDDSDPGTDCCGGQADDRWGGNYVLEFTQVADPASATATGDATTGWAEVATVTYVQLEDIQPGDGLTPYLRHEFDVSLNGEPILASGIRLSGLAGGTAIDELEVYVIPEPSSWCGVLLGLAWLCVLRRRR